LLTSERVLGTAASPLVMSLLTTALPSRGQFLWWICQKRLPLIGLKSVDRLVNIIGRPAGFGLGSNAPIGRATLIGVLATTVISLASQGLRFQVWRSSSYVLS
jgi:hypothetical protein